MCGTQTDEHQHLNCRCFGRSSNEIPRSGLVHPKLCQGSHRSAAVPTRYNRQECNISSRGNVKYDRAETSGENRKVNRCRQAT